MSFLHLIETCDNFRLQRCKEELASFCLSNPHGAVVGLLRPDIIAALKDDNLSKHSQGLQPSWHIVGPTPESDHDRSRIGFESWIDTPEKRSLVMKELCESWHHSGRFMNVIGGRLWRNELYPVYITAFGPHDSLNFAFCMERAACALFGVVTYGVHMTIYRNVGSSLKPGIDDVHVWVPRRAKTKQTWPGYFDNSVAGGIAHGMNVYDSLIKESMEEASVPQDVVVKYAKAVGSISYFSQTPKGTLQPEIEYVYDLCLPPEVDVQPTPLDGEVESFELLPLKDVIVRMHAGLFKPNTALVLLDFMIRHGLVGPDDEPHFMEIITRLHGRFEYETW